MDARAAIDKVRSLFRKSETEQQYEPLHEDASSITTGPSSLVDDDGTHYLVLAGPEPEDSSSPISWFEYSIFLLLGISMLWAWNMFLAAAPYFQARFQDDPRILSSFQPAITSVACVTNLSSMLILGHLQAKANYPRRILFSLAINILVFSLLALSTQYFRGISSPAYLAFTLIMVFTTSIATGLCQNGAFAFASGFGRPEYIQAILTGQAIAGVLPSVAQILSVLAVPRPDNWQDPKAKQAALDRGSATSALVYFLTATIISVISLMAVFPLIRKHNRINLEANMISSISSVDEAEQSKRKVVSMWTLYKKLKFLPAAVFICFLITMFFPVYTSKIVSIMPEDRAPRLFQPSAFIPLGFLVWNLGDLTGRLATLLPGSPSARPLILFIIAILRGGHLPVYYLCNIENHGAVINSDAFYLFIGCFGFGLTNGWLSSSCMMDAGKYVEDGEREATGGFMAVNLVAGLTVGSLLSFGAAGTT